VSGWPKCKVCGDDMWIGKVGAPVQEFHGCSRCGTKRRVRPPEFEPIELPLFELDEGEAS
jgi:hypothetical protein